MAVAFIGIGGQLAMAKRTADLAQAEALRKQRETMLTFRLKQMDEFYAPMFALLGQSLGLYDKIMHQLVQDEPRRYRKNPQLGSDGYRYEVLDKNGQWEGFRLLDQLPAIRKNAKALALVDGIVRIGEQMTGIISKNAGLAAEDLINPATP